MIKAIDIHTHPADAKSQEGLFDPEMAKGFYGHFKAAVPNTPMEQVAQEYRRRNMMAVVLA